ncbi:MAG: carboxypeptidase-like regulatory domain-containing protein [Ignavibacteriales bacterium]|nr:carboxypeptidase-like regulatory domain-containing protein [Ignavibacteriales bacterium]
MKTLMRPFLLSALVCLFGTALMAQTGKVSGTVVDDQTGEALISANVIVEGTTLGAATNLEGFFVILNVPPGTYSVRASMIGYTPVTTVNVRAAIDQTTELAFRLRETALQTEEVVVVASRPIVERGVSSSRANITAREVENLPISQVSSVIGLQAGVQGLTIRGGESDQTAFIVNGLTLRDERDNTPYTAISLLSVQDIQIQTGGFNAEYGNVRSGVVNVITKEGDLRKYNVGVFVRYSLPSRKYFGIAPNHPDSYWIRPFVDDAVAWSGTKSGAWDEWTQRQFKEFEGWNSISQKLLADNDPTNDLSPQAAQQVFLWQHRKSFDIKKPDYDLDIGFGGPVPGGEVLGKLRFYASGRWTSNQFVVPLSRDGSTDYNANLKLTSDIDQGMKLMVEGLFGRNESVDRNQTGVYGSFTSPQRVALAMDRVSFIDTRLFTTDYWAPNSVERNMVGAKFTHVLNPSTFYEVSFNRFASSYGTSPGRWRDTTRAYKFGNNYFLDEAPFGFFPSPGDYSTTGIDGMRMAIGMSNARDTSKVASYTFRFDFSSQLDRFNEMKAGLEFVQTDNAVNYGSFDLVLQSGRSTSVWHTFPKRFSAYVQDKLEFEGMVANVGLRFELSHAGGEWFVYDPFYRYFQGSASLGIDTLLEKEPTKVVTAFSPRLGVAFPVSEDAKLFFNYGHFRSIPTPENLFLVRRETATQSIIRLADPNLPLQRTVAYELGYEHNLFDMFLLRGAGYYKNISDQSRIVSYVGYYSTYSVTTNNSYEDIRGFEFTLTKNRGTWVQGFVNYTYMVSTSGAFGRATYYENPVEQKNDLRTNPQQFKPIPRPYGRANVDFFTPTDFGPEFAGFYPVGDFRINFLAAWTSGFHFTWVGGGSFPGISNNIRWKDRYSFDMRISKSFAVGPVNIQLFMDIDNVLNLKQMTTFDITPLTGRPLSFVDAQDYENYMKSLHLPSEFERFGYGNIAGNDQPGDYRKSGVPFQPIVHTQSLASISNPSTTPFYYEASSGGYYQWTGGQWQAVDQGKLAQVLEDKAYIDMPNQPWFTFLNPRDIYFGIRFSVDL